MRPALFLDERARAHRRRVLRVLPEPEPERVGCREAIKVDVCGSPSPIEDLSTGIAAGYRLAAVSRRRRQRMLQGRAAMLPYVNRVAAALRARVAG